MSGALSAAIFRRGGPKKELFLVSAEDYDEAELEEKLRDLTELLHADKTGKDLSAAIWRPSVGAAELVLSRRSSTRDIGYVRGKKTYLHIEEAVFLVDRSDMLLFVEDAHGQRRLLSLQECYDLMITNGVSMERYVVYSRLNRSGYLVMRHPSRWVLGGDETQQSVWGARAWADCFPQTPQPPQAQPTLLQPETTTSAAATATFTQHQAPDSIPAPSDGSSAEACPMDSEQPARMPPLQVNGNTGGGPSLSETQGGGFSAGEPLNSSSAVPVASLKRKADSLSGEVEPQADSETTPASTERTQRSWWLPTNSLHPWLAAVAHLCQVSERVDITQRTGDQLRDLLPRLRPFAKIPRSQHLGPVRSASHLVFDVYKPGSHVSRMKGVFPSPQYHLAICSESPPTLQDMRAADLQGLFGVRIKWLAVENGDISTYGMDPVDLMHLM
ncbi:MAG: hypothetical protein WDW38_001477 [Sanguina aurantia]